MEQLIRKFGAWLKQGFGWLVDVIVFGCLWGISQVSRLFWYTIGQRSDPEDCSACFSAPAHPVCVLLGVRPLYRSDTRALDRIAYALGVILFSAARSVRSVRQRRARCGCGNLGDGQRQLGLAMSHYEALCYTP
jgi:hypothetical protein